MSGIDPAIAAAILDAQEAEYALGELPVELIMAPEGDAAADRCRAALARMETLLAAQAARLAAAERVVAAAVDAMAFVAPERWPSILVRDGGREALIRLRDETAALVAREGEAG